MPKSARSAQTHKSISFIWSVWSTLYVYLWPRVLFAMLSLPCFVLFSVHGINPWQWDMTLGEGKNGEKNMCVLCFNSQWRSVVIGTVSSVFSLAVILGTLAYHEDILQHLESKLQEKRCAHHYSSFASENPLLLPHNTTSRVRGIRVMWFWLLKLSFSKKVERNLKKSST